MPKTYRALCTRLLYCFSGGCSVGLLRDVESTSGYRGTPILQQEGGAIHNRRTGSLVFNSLATFFDNGASDVSLPM